MAIYPSLLFSKELSKDSGFSCFFFIICWFIYSFVYVAINAIVSLPRFFTFSSCEKSFSLYSYILHAAFYDLCLCDNHSLPLLIYPIVMFCNSLYGCPLSLLVHLLFRSLTLYRQVTRAKVKDSKNNVIYVCFSS